MRVVGLMSGTSYDGIDVAVADLELVDGGGTDGTGGTDVAHPAEAADILDGPELTLRPRGHLERPFPPELRELLATSLPPASVPMETVCRLDTLLGQAFAEAAADGVDGFGEGRADVVVSHGQTVFHWVESGRTYGTLQLGQPAWIAERTGVPVVSDLRGRDVAKGGQGAPLVSVVDALLWPPGASTPRGALNLGGIANLTVIDPDGVHLAYDLGAANALIDAATTLLFDEAYDADGRHATAGRVHEPLFAVLATEPYYAQEAPKTTGKELFHAAYLERALSASPGSPRTVPEDVVATVTELTAWLVARDTHRHGIGELVVSGGGVRNPRLLERIRDRLDQVVVRRCDELGLPGEAKEAYAFAVLGYLSVHGLPGTLPGCTGARESAVLGNLTPGAEPLRLPQPAQRPPVRLRVQT